MMLIGMTSTTTEFTWDGSKHFIIMANTLVIIAVVIWLVTIAFACLTDHSWRNVGITWGLIVLGAVFFGIALTL